MLDGTPVDTEMALQVALARLSVMMREAVLMEAALNTAHQELGQLRMMQPTDTEVIEDAAH